MSHTIYITFTNWFVSKSTTLNLLFIAHSPHQTTPQRSPKMKLKHHLVIITAVQPGLELQEEKITLPSRGRYWNCHRCISKFTFEIVNLSPHCHHVARGKHNNNCFICLLVYSTYLNNIFFPEQDSEHRFRRYRLLELSGRGSYVTKKPQTNVRLSHDVKNAGIISII